MIFSVLLLAGALFGGLKACNHGSTSVSEFDHLSIERPCFDRRNIVANAQLLLDAAVEKIGPQPLKYRGNLTVTGCSKVGSSGQFPYNAEMPNMTIWNVSRFNV